ncbi:MAG: GNAT family N-acetyltransferase [Desulfobacterales bacterium]|nr:GNAT family N-acetyltransferase [Desulfobacterales bacterium]
MKNKELAHMLLVHPPVTSPAAPPWVLANAAGKLSGTGICLEQYDVNLDFFLNHFLTSENLTGLMGVIEKRKMQGGYKEVDTYTASLLANLTTNHGHWESKIASVGRSLKILRTEDFYRPGLCMAALKEINDLLALGSLAFYPSRIRRDGFSNPAVRDWAEVGAFLEDQETNPFLSLCQERLAHRIARPGLGLLILTVCAPDQLLAALTVARFTKKLRSDLHVALLGHDMLLKDAADYVDSLLPETDLSHLFELIDRLGGSSALKKSPVPDFTGLPLKDYLAPAVVLPFGALSDSRTGLIPPSIFLTILKEQVQNTGADGFLIEDDRLTPAYMAQMAARMAGEQPSFCLGLTCPLENTAGPENMAAARQAGLRLIQWHDPAGLLERLTKSLWDVSRAEVWNHIVIPAGPESTLVRGLIRFVGSNPNIAHSWVRRNPPGLPFESPVKQAEQEPGAYTQVAKLPGLPLWRGLNDPAYLLLYVSRHGVKKVIHWRVQDDGASVHGLGENMVYHFVKPRDLPPGYLDEICRMVEAGGSVGTKWVSYNLERAFLIGYVLEHGLIVGNSSLKHPRPEYVEGVNRQSGLDLSQYLERGYTSVRPEYRGMGIGTKLLEGLTARIGNKKLFSIIGSDNVATQKIALRNKTRRVATFYSERLGKEIGVWIPERML